MAVDVVLRPGRPDPEDGLFFAEGHDQAADGLFRLMLGRRAPRILATAYLSAGHDLSHEHTVIAELGGRRVGMCTAYPGRGRSDDESPLIRAAGVRALRLGVVALVLTPVIRFMQRVDDDAFYVQAVAVEPDARGHGIGTLLMADAERRARDAGARWLELDVDDDNTDARRLYERLGFSVTATSPTALGLPRTRVHRMRRELTDG